MEAFPIESNIEDEKQGIKPEPVEQLKEIKLKNGTLIKISGEITEQGKKHLEQVL